MLGGTTLAVADWLEDVALRIIESTIQLKKGLETTVLYEYARS